MSILYHNGLFLTEGEIRLNHTNRAFRYADGCFESIRVMDGVPTFWNQHWSRLSATLKFLEIKPGFTELSLKSDIRKLLIDNEVQNSGWIKIMIYREGVGTYFPESNKAGVIIECGQSDNTPPNSIIEKRGGFYRKLFLPKGEIGNFKTTNKTIHVMAATYSQSQNWHDAVLLNGDEEIAEAISSNVFLVVENQVLTPSLDSGCLNGTIRKVLTSSNDIPFTVIEKRLYPEDLEQADEIWASNARSGISAFAEFEGKSLLTEKARQMQQVIHRLAINSLKDFQESLT